MVYQFAVGLALASILVTPVAAQTDPYAAFLDEIGSGDGGACRRLNAQERIDNWNEPPVDQAFAAVEAIMADVEHSGFEFAVLGCNRDFRFVFRACTQTDNPALTHIVPRGIVAATVPERIALMRVCLGQAEDAGLKP